MSAPDLPLRCAHSSTCGCAVCWRGAEYEEALREVDRASRGVVFSFDFQAPAGWDGPGRDEFSALDELRGALADLDDKATLLKQAIANKEVEG